MIGPFLLALALAQAQPDAPASGAPPGTSVPSTAPADAPAAPVDARAAEAGDPGPRTGHSGWRHAIGLGPHSTTFFSEQGSQYTFHSLGLGYLGSIGQRGAFLHAFLLVPLQARQDGHVYATGDYYSGRWGADLLLGPEWRWTWRGHIEVEAGPGFHGTLIYLPAKAGYRDFSAFPLGLGAGTVLRWDTSKHRLSRVVTIGTYASAAYDLWDPMHAGDLQHGFSLRLGVIVGLGGRV